MNAPFTPERLSTRLVDPGDVSEAGRIGAFLEDHPGATPFHRPEWINAVAKGTGNRAIALLGERGGAICAYLPLSEVRSPIFGAVLASSGFAVNGGLLTSACDDDVLFAALEELVGSICKMFDLQCTFHADEGIVVKDVIAATHVYRIAQEAINNAVKHASATEISVLVQKADGRTVLTIEDNGLSLDEFSRRFDLIESGQ